eukprot:2211105-Amphidinium_carterae.2
MEEAIMSGFSGEDSTRIGPRLSSQQGLALGFKRELRLELLLDVMESISENTPGPLPAVPEIEPMTLHQDSSVSTLAVRQWCKRRRPPCYEAETFQRIRRHFGIDEHSYAAAFASKP